MARHTPNTLHQQIKAALTSMQTIWPADQKSVTLLKVTYTPPELQQRFQTLLAPFQSVADLHAAWTTAVADRNDAMPAAQAFMSAFYEALPQYLGPNNADQTKFGKRPSKARAATTAKEKAVATEKRNATRAARHIMGPKQRSAIKAPVAAPEPEPATPPATPAPLNKPAA